MSNHRRAAMKRLALALVAGMLGVVLFPNASPAKGPIQASVEGPGLGAPIRFGGWEENGPATGAPLMEFAEAAGFFPAALGQEPSPLLPARPKGDLGPRYVVEYLVPGPAGEEDRILQDLYPYATPDPVTYMAPGQSIFGTHATRGGWFAAKSPAAPPLGYILAEAGLPKTPPTEGDGSPFPWTIVAVLAVVGSALALGAVATVLVRRRPEIA
ncbi:MAG: hypothetical protein ACRDNY_01395 [Gaiellaceae bacterium]